MDVLNRWVKRALNRPQETTGCLSCGHCCETFGTHLRASRADLERWEALGREDLLASVNRLGWIWTDPQSGCSIVPCPHLVRQSADTACCAIHDIKPDMCRDYPTLAHGRRCPRGVFLALPLLACAALELAWELLEESALLDLAPVLL